MGKKADNLSTFGRSNKTMLTAHKIDVIVMSAFCVLQVLGGFQKPGYAWTVLILGFLPIIIENFLWKKNQENTYIKYIAAIGFMIFYTFCLFTSTNQMVFIFAIPIVLAAYVYNDVKYSILINLGVILESFIVVFVGASTGLFGYLGMDYGIIQIVSVILIGIYSLNVTRTLNQNFEQILAEMSDLSEKMKSGILDMSVELEKLMETSQVTMHAMQDVSGGTNDTASAVQDQLLQTQSIQNKTGLVTDSIQSISENMLQTIQELNTGNQDVAVLVEKVENSVKNSERVVEKLKALDKAVEEMNSVTEVIRDIAKQTGLLAINARIEASHAGSYGKGFGVVAAEISEMATQTGAATTHITELTENAFLNIEDVVKGVYQLTDGINAEKQSTERTADSFASILDSTKSVQKHVEILVNHMEELKRANRMIIDSVQTISAVSEQVSAHAAETIHAESENVSILEKIDYKMKQLMELIK